MAGIRPLVRAFLVTFLLGIIITGEYKRISDWFGVIPVDIPTPESVTVIEGASKQYRPKGIACLKILPNRKQVHNNESPKLTVKKRSK